MLAIEQAVAAPLATRLLARDGARVIKVERPVTGDFARSYDGFAAGACSYFTWLNTGKESLCADLSKPDDLELVRNIARRADVVVQNLAPGAAQRLGLDARTLRRTNPDLITCEITGYGSQSRRKAYDLVVAAEAGLCAVTGSDGGGPGRVGVSIVDIHTGRLAHTAVMRGLLRRTQRGGGASFSISMFDAVAELMTVPLLQYRATGRAPRRLGLRHPSIAPYGAYACAGGELVLLSVQNEREWVALVEALGLSHLARDDRFVSATKRVEFRTDLEAELMPKFARLDFTAATELLDRAGVANARVSRVEDLSVHPLLRTESVINELGVETSLPVEAVVEDYESEGESLVDSSPMRVPRLGEHTEVIRAEFSRPPRPVNLADDR